MTNEKLIITISTEPGKALTVDAHALPNEAAQHVRLYRATPEASRAAQAAESAQPPAEIGKTPPVPAPQAAAPKMKPWENLTGTPKSLNFQPSPELHAKMQWVCDNVPGGKSRLAILREGAMMLCDAMIAKHYKE